MSASNKQVSPISGSLVDLTLLLAEDLPSFWSTHMPYQQKTFNYFEDKTDNPSAPLFSRVGPYQTRWLLIDEHTGTHFDAPAHFIPPAGSGMQHAGEAGSIYADNVDLNQLCGPAVVIDVPSNLPGAAPGISPVIPGFLILEHEKIHGVIMAGDIVIFRSSWDDRYQKGPAGEPYCFGPLILKRDPGWPAPENEAMQILIDRGVRCIGTDSPSMGSTHDGGPVHVLALSKGICFIEALANLRSLPNTGAWFMFAPLRIAHGTGAPGRALAIVPTKSGESI
jgi:kynurenine formamidase